MYDVNQYYKNLKSYMGIYIKTVAQQIVARITNKTQSAMSLLKHTYQ